MSHRARAQRATPPVEVADRVAVVVGSAFQRWADRFVALVVSDIVVPDQRFRADAWLRLDATVQGLFNEAGKARPDPERLRGAFRMLESKSADEMRTVGVRTRDVLVGAEGLQQPWVRQNTDLIRAEQDLRRRVERIISDPLNQGRSVADITKLLQEQAGYSRSRAELTARDQTLKLYGQIQERRQQAAGISRYVWTTSLDERVREDHARLDGTVQSWDDPPIVDQRTGRRGHPGSDFQCRCTAVPVLDDDVETGGEPPPAETVMVSTQAERDAERRAADLARSRAEAEAAADRRIAEQRAALAEAQQRIAEQRTAEQRTAEQRTAEQRVAAALHAAVAVPDSPTVEPVDETPDRLPRARRRRNR
jgi:SPP1 gp7 family putative phage head morphogenesis protein